MQRYLPTKGATAFTLRVILNLNNDHQHNFQFYALSSSVRIDGRTEVDADQWIKLNDIDNETLTLASEQIKEHQFNQNNQSQ